jgi:ferritin-like metal-binding protein YciE
MTAKDPREAVNSYISDMLSLEHHIKKALDGQVGDLKDYPQAMGELERMNSTVEFHISALEGVLNARGGKSGDLIKKVGSAIAGLGAAAVDAVRNEGAPKDLRDDYTAFNLATIGYLMLHTTALSLGDSEVGALAQRHMSDYAKMVMDLQNIIPGVVVQFLQAEGLPANQGVLSQVSSTIDEVWRQPHTTTSATGGMTGGSTGSTAR